MASIIRINVLCHVLFSTPDGKSLAITGRAGIPIIWDVASGKPLMSLMGQQGEICKPKFSPDGQRLIGGGDGGVVKIWQWIP